MLFSREHGEKGRERKRNSVSTRRRGFWEARLRRRKLGRRMRKEKRKTAENSTWSLTVKDSQGKEIGLRMTSCQRQEGRSRKRESVACLRYYGVTKRGNEVCSWKQAGKKVPVKAICFFPPHPALQFSFLAHTCWLLYFGVRAYAREGNSPCLLCLGKIIQNTNTSD